MAKLNSSQKLSGPQKAAAALLALGEEASAIILRNLETDEIKALGTQISFINGIRQEITEELLQDFSSQFRSDDSVRIPGDQFIRKVLTNVMQNQDQADDLMESIEKEKQTVPFKHVKEIDSKILAGFIRNEHPQTIAIILVHLGFDKASQVIGFLPEALQFEVMNRIATLETVPPDLIHEVDEVLEQELVSLGKSTNLALGGVPVVAEILNHCDRRTGDNILQSLEDSDTELAERVRKLMFVFEDLAGVSDQGIRDLLKEVRNEELTLALKTASEDLKSKVFKNLSQRAAQMLQEDMAMMGPTRLSDVELAQQGILNVARRLEKEGKLMLAGKDGGDTLV